MKTKLNIPSEPPQIVAREELEYRFNQVNTFIERFLSNHDRIARLQELNRGTMLVDLKDGNALKVFVTNTYYFTDYTLDRVLEVDPAINAIICSSPAGQYSESAKTCCIEKGIGLFMLGEFMGAIRHNGENYLNFLLRADSEARSVGLKRILKNIQPPARICVYAFGSFLRRRVYRDVDLLIVYEGVANIAAVKNFESLLFSEVQKQFGQPDITVASTEEFSNLKLKYNNLTQVYP